MPQRHISVGDVPLSCISQGAPPFVGTLPPVELSKPRLCHDDRYDNLNLWIRDLPFKLDHLCGLPRLCSPRSLSDHLYKSGYQYVLLHPYSLTILDSVFPRVASDLVTSVVQPDNLETAV